MKSRDIEPQVDTEEGLVALAKALRSLRNDREVVDFLYDLCTPAELEAMSDRWQVVLCLLAGETGFQLQGDECNGNDYGRYNSKNEHKAQDVFHNTADNDAT